MPPKFIVPDERPVGRSTKRAILLFVHLLKQGALVKLDRLFKILAELVLGQIQHSDLQHRARLALVDQVMKPSP